MKVLVAGYGYLGAGDPAALLGADGIVETPMGIGEWMGLDGSPAAPGSTA